MVIFKSLFVSLLLLILLMGCSTPFSEDEFNTFQEDFNYLIQLVLEKQLDRNEDILDGGKPKREDIEIETVIKKMERLLEDNKKNIAKEQKETFEEMVKTQAALLSLNAEVSKKSSSEEVIKTQEEQLQTYAVKFLTEFNVETTLADSVLGPAFTDDDVETFKSKNGIRHNALDVQYNLSKYIDTEFVIVGKIELSDYYNYGFDDIESNYFNAKIRPYGGDYSDEWHLYFHRDSFDDLFNQLKDGRVDVIVSANIPSYRYEKNQGNMAIVESANWK
ncbi:hypothetical protein ACOI1C_14060 [Bacillus sp. DJP31]|uniref:hypothetical protein n=1 Tax=Bacillus sp. DJP31 TaxID=3409789 RepID=UPI003BB5B6E1